MNLTEARKWVRQFCTDANDDSKHAEAVVDRAIQYAGNEFCRISQCLRRTDSVTLNAGSPTFAPPAGRRPERVIDVFLSGKSEPLTLVGYPHLNAARANSAGTGTPGLLAFLDAMTAEVFPTPDVGYTAKLRHWLPFTT